MIERASACLVGFLVVAGGWANVYAVGNTNDSGAGSLRSAIEQANAHAGADSIGFNPALSGATIRPQSALPDLTDDGTTINGDIAGDGAPHVVLDGRDLAVGSGLTVAGNACEIRGLAIVRFPGRGIFLNGATECVVAGCHIGVNLAGTATALNGQDQVLALDADANTVGGTATADRNIIAGAADPYSAIRVWGGNDNLVLGNYLGIRRAGSAVLGVGRRAILITGLTGGGSGNRVGGSGAGAGNLIGGVEDGVSLHAAQGTRILGNTFGLLADGSGLAPISGQCVTVHDGSTGTTIGGLAARARNVFAGGAQSGVSVYGTGTSGTRIMGNYFGTDTPGTHRRDLANGVIVGLGAGVQTIGGTDPDAGNYFTPSDLLGNAQGISVGGTRVVVQNNTFGTLPNGVGASGMGDAVALLDSTASVLDNDIAHASGNGVRVDGAGSTPRVFRNRFRDCWYGVRIDVDARCQLGNLGNASLTDNGGNSFASSNDWFISNNTPNTIKAEGNSFGTKSRAAIDAKIWDREDEPAFGRVDFDPLSGGVHPSGGAETVLVSSLTALPGEAGTEIIFALSAPAEVTVHVLNVAGRPIATPLLDAPREAGMQRVVWSGHTASGLAAPAGAYVVKVSASAPDGQRSEVVGLLRLRP